MSGETSRQRGRARELAVAGVLRTQYGMVAYRLAHGRADVLGLKAGELPLLVQVKGTRRPFERFGPVERRELMAEAIAGGARCVLAHWPKGGRLRFVTPDEWPEGALVRVAA